MRTISECWLEANKGCSIAFHLCSSWRKCVVATINEAWVYFEDQETKQQPMEWRHSQTPNKFRVQKSSGKVFVSFFWDFQRVIIIHYFLDKSRTMIGNYCSTLLTNSQEKIVKRRRRGCIQRCFVFAGNNLYFRIRIIRTPSLFTRSGSVGLSCLSPTKE